MIPPVLWAYWRGDAPSWLRRQTLATWRRHEPGTDVRLLVDDEGFAPDVLRTLRQSLPAVAWPRPSWWPELAATMPPDARSDVVRWCALAAEGGFFTDLDVLYLAPVPDALRDAPTLAVTVDGGTPELRGNRAFAIGLAAAPSGCPLAEELAWRARERAASWSPEVDHQACGTGLLARELRVAERAAGVAASGIPAALLYPQGFLRAENAAVWDERRRPPLALDGLLGLHWGGGHARSREREAAVDEACARSASCAVARAWRRGILGAE